jgi:transposase-like protein
VIAVAGALVSRYGLSYRDVEELLAERGVEVDHVTIYWWVQTFTPTSRPSARSFRCSPKPLHHSCRRITVVWNRAEVL